MESVLEEQNIEDVPKVGMCFGTIEDANQFYQNYAKRVGFVTKIRFTRRVGKDKVPKNQMITCNREGKRKSRVSPIEKTNPRTNYNCPARISIRLNKEGLWIISKVCLDHSHPCDPEMAKLLTRNREMTMHMCRVIERNDEAGVRPSKTYQVLVGEAGGFSKINLMEKDVRNYLSRKITNGYQDVSTSKERVYEVNYNAKTKDITCMCQMFESRGILCRHSLVVLGHERVREIPRRYILDRWSKLVKRRHSDIKSSHDPSLLNPKTERFDDLCSHSNSVAQFASQTKETSDILHRYLGMAMADCQKHVANSSSNVNELDNLLTSEDGGKDGGKDALSIFVGGCIISIQDIKSPPYVFTKGRLTNRLGSEKDKMIKKKTEAKKRKSEITEKEDNQHIGDIQSLPFNEQVHPILQDANYNVNEGFESDSMGASMGGFMSLLNSIHSYQFSNVD
ncbi:hypothetical protein Ahy_A01g003600 [Arachis hypogaea]|uniref:SWIM-type domain-containing protein n=1 Tax=Arachis hypogaea TaxID=3818 RepID=A0A445ETK8_ARAHY|nr:hypothetical protein Ahy_A01g003600 [Arachis hypogaea]